MDASPASPRASRRCSASWISSGARRVSGAPAARRSRGTGAPSSGRPCATTRRPGVVSALGGLVADLAAGTAEARDLVIEDGRIAAILAPGTAGMAGAEHRDARDRLILPGLVNSHTHGHANLVKGVADRWTLEASLTHGPWMGGARDVETIHLSTLVGALDMVSKGCTACFDLVYEFPRPSLDGFMAVARAYADAGMRAVLAPMVADRTLFAAIPGLADSLPEDLRAEVGRFALGSGEATIEAL